jgi:hypothetical protein
MVVKIKQDLLPFVNIVEHLNNLKVILLGKRKLIYSSTIILVSETSYGKSAYKAPKCVLVQLVSKYAKKPADGVK